MQGFFSFLTSKNARVTLDSFSCWPLIFITGRINMAIHIVMVNPEIPPNTGNIARTCAATNCVLHLVKPLGFDIDEKSVRRAGLDYWDKLTIKVYENLADFYAQNEQNVKDGAQMYYASTKAKKVYSDVRYKDGDYLLFGKETKGIDEAVLKANYDRTVRIPMWGEIRSLNLSNSVAILLYEALRQNDFDRFTLTGKLRGETGNTDK